MLWAHHCQLLFIEHTWGILLGWINRPFKGVGLAQEEQPTSSSPAKELSKAPSHYTRALLLSRNNSWVSPPAQATNTQWDPKWSERKKGFFLASGSTRPPRAADLCFSMSLTTGPSLSSCHPPRGVSRWHYGSNLLTGPHSFGLASLLSIPLTAVRLIFLKYYFSLLVPWYLQLFPVA